MTVGLPRYINQGSGGQRFEWKLVRIAVIFFIASVIVAAALLTNRSQAFSFLPIDWVSSKVSHGKTEIAAYFDLPPPIAKLFNDARLAQDDLLKKRSLDLPTAAAQYRKRRGRHPPPGFDAWVAHALQTDSIVVEEFFDRIYKDVGPFWGLHPQVIVDRAATWQHVVSVRNGVATGLGNVDGRVPWLRLWTDLVNEAAAHLPDVDMPINYMDESRLLVPWDAINNYTKADLESRHILASVQVTRKYSALKTPDRNNTAPYEPEWVSSSREQWNLARRGCHPDSPSRNVPLPASFEQPAQLPEDYKPDYSYKGYVQNFTAASDPCLQPHLRELHGTFIESISMSSSDELIPLFGGSKLPMNNEILIPGAMYLPDAPFYSGGITHGPPWREKIEGTVWRGVASGGRNKKENWTHFQRHRLVEMLNGTTVSAMEEQGNRTFTFSMPSKKLYDLKITKTGTLGRWLSDFADAGFVELLCHPREDCSYLEGAFGEVPSIPMAEQYKSNYIPDADGNSFSARFRGLLLSASLPIKATIYSEWHDDRLMPWLHFAPMDNTFQDLYAILDFFTQDSQGDKAAQLLAEEGQAWASKVLRREDMRLYVWRLLLEWARVCDEKRETLGFVDDLYYQDYDNV